MIKIIKHIKDRIKYLEKYRIEANNYSNGFSGNESGECCKKCIINPESIAKSGRAVFLRALVGCKDPFQIKCKCHIKYRQATTEAEIGLLKELLWYLEIRPDLL